MKQHKSVSILRRMTLPLILLVVVQYLLLGGALLMSGVFDKLNYNAVEMLNQRLINRAIYINDEIDGHKKTTSEGAAAVTAKISALLYDGSLSHSEIGKGGDGDELILESITDDILNMLCSNRSTGAFIFLYSENLNIQFDANSQITMAGLYFRDAEPLRMSIHPSDDITALCAPDEVLSKIGIVKGRAWRSVATIKTDDKGHAEYFPFIYEPYQAAQKFSYPANELGYWSMPFDPGDGTEVITYSMPLVLPDGSLCGVIGMDFTTEFLRSIIPHEELLINGNGSYLIAAADNYSNMFTNIALSGDSFLSDDEQPEYTFIENGFDSLVNIKNSGSSDTVACIQYLNMYETVTPYENNQWALFGVVKRSTLFNTTDSVVLTISLAASISMAIGVIVIFAVSCGITKPIHDISRKLRESDSSRVVVLDKINITEIDELSSSVQHLSEDLYASATKFSRIVKMASINIGAFEISNDGSSLFLTDNFFKVFTRPGLDSSNHTVESFNASMEQLKEFIIEQNDNNTNIMFRIPFEGERRYIQLKIMYENERVLGLAEDITLDVVEKQKIVYERDYDLLTGLLNRRAFKRSIDLACREPEKLYTGFMLMMDLDNLKYINDTYGHDYGDDYIRAAAECLKTSLADYADSAIISRISGDEFFVFAYGFSGKADARIAIASIKDAIAKKDIRIPNGKEYKLRASGGISWYPSDSTNISQLMKYADFAMYKIKLTTKGKFIEFDRTVYERESFLLHSKGEFNRLIDENCVIYHFQPIVSVKTGKIFAYEALMRSLLPTLKSPYEIITLAKSEAKLGQIERLTWVNALSTYANHVDGGAIDADCKLFINSIINQIIDDEDIDIIEKLYAPYLSNIVIEMPNESRFNQEILQTKLSIIGKWNAQTAIDDYEDECERNLLTAISPSYIKIDLSIVREIDKTFEHQQLVIRIVAYAHERGIEVIAEGVETRAELEKLMEIGIDYVQGYIAAYPAAEPPEVNREFLEIIGMI